MWQLITCDVFTQWFKEQPETLQESVLFSLGLLKQFGPHLGRPHVDTLKGSKFSNMKELRIQHLGDPVRAFFIFDPLRRAIVMCAGDKTGINEAQFYKK
ncbi:hypothetical protein SAMN05660772_01484 [Pasteurella testudinis DSM 23072]|uniref:Type II toxin-antitoxin system RelE/ParE family toxin n=1 Tax=Pasteurella testudinis DSM 23072 TaxID=1122938 RepID=A0A1W1V9Z5_9PAST|nr:hypothetical protein SAMN05660772_01484 [Pasteurella testudinis DSM 23072]SUB51354.1 Uncharacterized protein conserved in bacteria [Pasteurella testudinis]